MFRISLLMFLFSIEINARVNTRPIDHIRETAVGYYWAILAFAIVALGISFLFPAGRQNFKHHWPWYIGSVVAVTAGYEALKQLAL